MSHPRFQWDSSLVIHIQLTIDALFFPLWLHSTATKKEEKRKPSVKKKGNISFHSITFAAVDSFSYSTNDHLNKKRRNNQRNRCFRLSSIPCVSLVQVPSKLGPLKSDFIHIELSLAHKNVMQTLSNEAHQPRKTQ